jgi:Tfp pilus assembly protein PilP
MMRARKICALLTLMIGAFSSGGSAAAQEPAKASPDTSKEAPASIGKTLQGLRDAAKDKLRQSVGEKGQAAVKAEGKTERVDLTVPPRQPESPAATPALKEGGRDPFRPMSLRPKVNTRSRENLSPLERLDLSQLKVVGIVWDIKEPRAMVEDTAGLGYVVKVGTPIGGNDGVVKAIHRNQVVVEETTADIYGVRRKRDVSMLLATE